MADPLFYIGKPEDEQNKIPNILKGYTEFSREKPISYLLNNNASRNYVNDYILNELYYKNMERVRQQKVPKTLPSSWKDNIDYNKGYSSEIEDKFRSEHDYIGLADYLSKFKMNNVIDQRAYEQEISQLRRYGRQYNAIQAHATDEQRESIAFLEAFNNGNIDNVLI